MEKVFDLEVKNMVKQFQKANQKILKQEERIIYLEEKLSSTETTIASINRYNAFLVENITNMVIDGAVNLEPDEKSIIDKLNFSQELLLNTRLCSDPAFSLYNLYNQLEFKMQKVFLRDPIIIHLERELMYKNSLNKQLNDELESMKHMNTIFS